MGQQLLPHCNWRPTWPSLYLDTPVLVMWGSAGTYRTFSENRSFRSNALIVPTEWRNKWESFNPERNNTTRSALPWHWLLGKWYLAYNWQLGVLANPTTLKGSKRHSRCKQRAVLLKRLLQSTESYSQSSLLKTVLSCFMSMSVWQLWDSKKVPESLAAKTPI